MSEDFRDLDGNALVARLAVVKERVLGKRNPDGSVTFGPDFTSERADTEAVLDECAVRLLGTEAPKP